MKLLPETVSKNLPAGSDEGLQDEIEAGAWRSRNVEVADVAMATAFTVTIFGFGTLAGAVYKPPEAEIVPPPDMIDHATGPVTLVRVALN